MNEKYIRIEENSTLIYTGDNRFKAASELLHFGIKQFKKTIHSTKVNELLADLESARDKGIFGGCLLGLTSDALIEYTRIIVCFQNYMFAKLLVEGYLVHKIDSNIFRSLAKKQQSKPAKITDFAGHSSYEMNSKEYIILRGLKKDETLNFSTLLKEKYQEIIKLPQIIQATLKDYNRVRNFQHFHIKETTAPIRIDKQVGGENECENIDQVKALYDFVEGDMIRLHDKLESQHYQH